MSDAALNLVPEAQTLPTEIELHSASLMERWMWTQASSRYSWWDALAGRPLKIATGDLLHMHGWRNYVCLELQGRPGEEIWIRQLTWEASNDHPEAPRFGDFRHFSRKLGLDLLLLLFSPVTLVLGLLYGLMIVNPFGSLASMCTPSAQEPFTLYLQIVSTLVATPVLTYGYYRLLKKTKLLSYQVRRTFAFTVAALFVISTVGLSWLGADATSRDTIAKIHAGCFIPKK